MPAIRAHEVMSFGLADIDAGAIEDIPAFVGAGTGHCFMEGQTEGFIYRYRVCLNPGDSRELLKRE